MSCPEPEGDTRFAALTPDLIVRMACRASHSPFPPRLRGGRF